MDATDFDSLYSRRPGELAALTRFVSPRVACVLGGSIGPMAYALKQAGFLLYTARSEQGAGYYGLGVGLASGLASLVLCVGGAAAAALAQPLWCARLRRIPLIAITGEVETRLAGRGAVQDGTGRDGPSIVALTRAVTCRSTSVWTPEEAWRELLVCLETALERREPAHLSIPVDVQKRMFER